MKGLIAGRPPYSELAPAAQVLYFKPIEEVWYRLFEF